MSSELIFYTNPRSRGRIARWMLEEVGASYETVVLDYATTMKGDEYRAINPMMKVPAIRHDGHVVTEAAAVCAYLADAFPDAGLAPPTTGRADYYRWLFYGAGPVEAAIANTSLGVEVSAEQQRMVGYGSLALVCSVLEQAVAQHPYITGDRFTAADVYVGSGIGWYTQFGILQKTPVFTDYLARIQSRPAFLRAAELDDALLR